MTLHSHSLIYAAFAYGCMAIFLFLYLNNFVKKSIQPTAYLYKYRLAFLLFIVVILVANFQYVYGIFDKPSVLTCLLCLFYSIHQIKNTYLNKYINTDYLYFNTKSLYWFYAMAFCIILSSLGVGIDIYHRYFNLSSIFWHFAVFVFVFVGAFYFDKKTLIIAYVCLFAYVCHLMNTAFILDYIADIWLFLLALYVGISYIWRIIYHLSSQLINKKPI